MIYSIYFTPEDAIQSQQFDNKSYSKQEQGGKPKRYSSQRQRNMPEVGGYPEQPIEGQKFYPQGKTTEIYRYVHVHICTYMCNVSLSNLTVSKPVV